MYGKHSKSVGQFLCGLLSVAATAKGLRQVRHGRVGDARVGGGDGGGEVQLEVDEAAVAGQVQVVAAKLLALLWITRAVSLTRDFLIQNSFFQDFRLTDEM